MASKPACSESVKPTTLHSHGWINVRRAPGDGFAKLAARLYERLQSSWFRSEWRKRLDDGCRTDGMEARTWRGIRLYAFWFYGVPRSASARGNKKP